MAEESDGADFRSALEAGAPEIRSATFAELGTRSGFDPAIGTMH
jgi:hypothetical protein